MRSLPPEVVASWPRPNYVNPETRGPDLIVATSITLLGALVCVALRFYVRVRIMRKTEIDDWVMVPAMIFSTAASTSIILAFDQFGWKHHVWDLRPEMLVTGRKASFATQAFFIPATLLTKISILLSYLRIAPLNSLFRRLSLVTPWVIALTTVVFWIVLFTECRPISSYWNLANNARDCVNETPVLFSYAISTVLFDFFVWVLPIPTIYHAKLPITQRLAIIALFSVALFVVVAAGIRIYYLDIVLRETYDVTWEGSHLWLWVAVEANLGIICGCVPWLKSLVKSWRRKRADSSLVSGGNSGSGNTRSGPRPGALQTIGSRGTVFRMDTLAKVSTGAREKAIYIDLESCYTPSEHGTREVAR